MPFAKPPPAGWIAQDRNFTERVRASFSRQPAMVNVGFELTVVEAGVVQLELAFDMRWTQQNGFLHAGVMAMGLDTACGYAAFSLMPASADVLTVEFKTNLLAPARGELFLFRGQVVKAGRRLTVSEGRALVVADGREDLVASMTATLMAMERH